MRDASLTLRVTGQPESTKLAENLRGHSPNDLPEMIQIMQPSHPTTAMPMLNCSTQSARVARRLHSRFVDWRSSRSHGHVIEYPEFEKKSQPLGVLMVPRVERPSRQPIQQPSSRICMPATKRKTMTNVIETSISRRRTAPMPIRCRIGIGVSTRYSAPIRSLVGVGQALCCTILLCRQFGTLTKRGLNRRTPRTRRRRFEFGQVL